MAGGCFFPYVFLPVAVTPAGLPSSTHCPMERLAACGEPGRTGACRWLRVVAGASGDDSVTAWVRHVPRRGECREPSRVHL